MSDVCLDHVTMRFGDFTAVADINLGIEAGEFFSFLGPSGCGKTTILRMISGFIEPTAGRVLIGGRDMRGIGPHRRPTALIFQNLALFPLMSVWENIAFGLEVRGVDRRTRRRRAEELLELVALSDAADKSVAQLSGGQRQRVAIARALAVEPQVLLLDEPLSALDLKLRQHMRAELKAIQRRTNITFIYITHDQHEALAMSDRVAVMSHGRIEQVDTPDAIYDAPETPFVATFVGETNAFTGRVRETFQGLAVVDTDFGLLRGRNLHDLTTGAPATLFVRPERMTLLNGTPLDNVLTSEITHESFEGPFRNLFLRGRHRRPITLQVVNDGRPMLASGTVTVGFEARHAVVLPAREGSNV